MRGALTLGIRINKMKFTKTYPQFRDTRIKTFFAWFPVSIFRSVNYRVIKETRWLEMVTVKQSYGIWDSWENVSFLNK